MGCLLLFGCGDDKVTKEYLVGDWRCNWQSFERMDSGREESSGNVIDKNEYITTFNMVDDKLYTVLNNGKLRLYDIDKIYDNPTHEFLKEDGTFSVIKKISLIKSWKKLVMININLR